MTRRGYPNAHVRLRSFQTAPAVPDRDSELEIWLKGMRFRVRDPACRPVSHLLEDVTAARGLGRPIRSIEELMDLDTEARLRRGAPPTDLFGDLASGDGWVHEPVGRRWRIAAAELAPIAEQILSRGKAARFHAVGPTIRLGRAATEYRGFVDVREEGEKYRNAVTRVIAPPFLLFEEAHDAAHRGLSHRREIVSLEEDTVADSDLLRDRFHDP